MTGTLRSGTGADADLAEDAAVRRWLIVALFASIFLQRFGVPIGQFGIAINLAVTLLALGAIAARGALGVDPLRVLLFCVFITAVWVSAMLNASSASMNSVLLVTVVYAPYALALRRPEGVFDACARAFQTMVLVCAVAGIIQFMAQFAVDPALIFTFHGLMPDAILLKGWGNMQPLQYGHHIFKANGFFLNEPSVFSQYLALAIIIEVLFFGRVLRLAVYGVAILLSYSGTGLIPLVLLMPWILLHRRAYKALAALAVFGLVAIALGDLWHMDALLARAAEFGDLGTSAGARYQAGAILIAAYVLPWPPDLLFGLGPGSFLTVAFQQSFEAHDATVWKLIFEYGLVGAVSFWVMFCVVLFNRARSVWLAAALGIGFLTFGGTMLDTRIQVLILVFCTLTAKPRAAVMPAEPARPSGRPLRTLGVR